MKNKLFHNEKGLTVAELLATLVIASIIVLFISGIVMMIQKQYSTQKEEISHLSDVKIALKSITRDIRKADFVEVPDEKTIVIIQDTETITYTLDNERNLLKNGSIYLYEVTDFQVNGDQERIDITMKSGEQEESTTVILRRARE